MLGYPIPALRASVSTLPARSSIVRIDTTLDGRS